MLPKGFKTISGKICNGFRTILENTYTDFREVSVEDACGQVFVLSIFYGEEYIGSDGRPLEHNDIVRPIMYFQAKGQWSNKDMDINRFFQINENVFDEFIELGSRHELDQLIPLLREGETLGEPKNIGQSEVNTYFFLTVDCCACISNQYLRNLLDEGVFVIGLDDLTQTKISVDCQMSERKKITALIEENPVLLSIPFDKIDNFKQFHRETEKFWIDEKYIFVAMSFQDDPLLIDAYEAMKRTVKSLRKGLTCERVNDITDDFIINDKIIECIKKSRVMIVDLTGNRPNVYYELGYARALNKQVILVCREGETPHFDVRNQNIIFYNSFTTLETGLNKRLRTIFK